MKFIIEIYERFNDHDHMVDEIEKEFDSIEDAETWADETYNTDCFASVYEVENN